MSSLFDNDVRARVKSNLGRAAPQSARQVAIIFAFLLVITIAMRTYQPTGWLGSDDAAYYSAAEHILTGTPITRAHHHYARLAVVLPVAASVAVFGHHTWAVALPMFLASVVCVCLVVILGKLLFDWRAGLLAGLIVSVLPYFRVLSTTAYADTHVCLWATASVLFCVMALRKQNNPNPKRQRGAVGPVAGAPGSDRHMSGWPVACAPGSVWWFVACGFALGLAISAKVFAATTLCGLLALGFTAKWRSWKDFGIGAGAIVLGGLAFFLIEGAFYQHFAGDFFFSLHAHEQSQTGVPAMAGENAAATTGTAALIWDRLTLLMYPSISGWGYAGVLFWPAIVAACWLGGAVRCMALWAAGTFLLIAFVPVSLAGGYQPYPLFHGRHILPGCVPFALCLAFVSIRCVAWLAARRPVACWNPQLWPALALIVLAMGLLGLNDLRGFRDRPTGRVGDAIRQIIAATQWEDGKPIHMTPSMYWRYRILFPASMKSCLRVSAADGAPAWWRDVTPDIKDRFAQLPEPNYAYLLVTPVQLAGEAESWDYGVALPPEHLAEWVRSSWRGFTRDKKLKASIEDMKNPSEMVALVLGVGFPVELGAMFPSSSADGPY